MTAQNKSFRPSHQRVDCERGSALIFALISMLITFLLGMSIASTGIYEITVARNYNTNIEAFYIAEAGLNHALMSIMENNLEFSAVVAGADGTLDTEDDGILMGSHVPPGYEIPASGVSFGAGSYFVIVTGEDGGNGEDEAIRRLIVTSTGFGPNNSRARVEAVLSGDGGEPTGPGHVMAGAGTVFEMSGRGTVNCSLRSNGDIHLTGNAQVNGDATAAGTVSVGGSAEVSGTVTNGADPIAVPSIDPEDYRSIADYILAADGKVRRKDGAVVWNVNGGSEWNGWSLSGSTWVLGFGGIQKTLFVEGNVHISGHHGSQSDPFEMTLVATGSIKITGNNDLGVAYENAQLIAGTDIRITGNVTWSGWVGAHEQFYYSGNSTINGPVFAENASSISDLVTVNTITGSAVINCGAGSGSWAGLYGANSQIHVVSWREVRT